MILPKLSRVPLFRFLSQTAIERLFRCSTVVECSPGERFIQEGSFGSEVYVILESSVAIVANHQGRDTYVTSLGPGQVVGEAGLFTNVARTASVETQGRVRMLRFERDSFMQALLYQPEDGMRVLLMLVHDLLHKLQEVHVELVLERGPDVAQPEIDSMIDGIVPII